VESVTVISTILQSWYDQKFRSLTVILYISYGLLSLTNSVLYQKYFDFLALLVCCLAFYNMGQIRAVQVILLAYCVGFVVYATYNPFSNRGFAGVERPSAHHDLVARKIEVRHFEVVLARAAAGGHASVVVFAARGENRAKFGAAAGRARASPCGGCPV
jgi:predicted membrane channel-forming protein YqfA (hemolysin III family)